KVTLSTDNDGIDTSNEAAVVEVLDKLAGKIYYTNYGDNNLIATAQIAEGLTASSAKKAYGDVKFETAQGTFDKDSLKLNGAVITGDYETAVMRGAKSAMASTVLMWRSENADVLQRMGDVRLGTEESGIWAKYYGGESTFNRQNTEYQTSYKAYQVGYDKKLANDWVFGAAVSYNDATHTYENGGRGEGQAVGVSAYGGWTGKKGHYADVMVKGTKLDNDYTVFSDGRTIEVNGDYSTWAMSVSAEYGRRIELKNGVYVDPSVKLSIGKVQGKSYDADAGSKGKLSLDQAGFTSAVGELGIGIGKEFAKGVVYTKFALAHEFSGDFLTTYAGEETKHTEVDFGKIGDTWYEWQIGGSVRTSDNSYLYATYEQTFGGDTTEDWRVDAGMRWTF
ncbi:MAG: autotransporter outer membrane beta-barrel domain-containing protein, partial [Phascolarctobacterium sp.]|nr:autotransporter outer membrane beta-barrel domain-containing protein [Phascolarctobacterium sp.]